MYRYMLKMTDTKLHMYMYMNSTCILVSMQHVSRLHSYFVTYMYVHVYILCTLYIVHCTRTCTCSYMYVYLYMYEHL